MSSSASPRAAPGSVALLKSLWENQGASATPTSQPAKRQRREPAAAAAARGLWPPGAEEEVEPAQPASPADEEARQARLALIKAKFGTRRFLPPKQLPPAELRSQLGASESDLEGDDYTLQRWEPMPISLSETSNACCLNWCLKGMSGCVALASGLTHLWVLGAGQTIWIADSDSVRAERSGEEASVTLRFGQGDWLCLKAPSAAVAAHMAATVNARATKHAALRAKAIGGAPTDGAPAASEAGGVVAAEASGEA